MHVGHDNSRTRDRTKTLQNSPINSKKMGEEAGVGIEPASQTLLADATEAIPGKHN